MDLGTFSISLAVKDIEASRKFYEKFGFAAFAGNAADGNKHTDDQGSGIGPFVEKTGNQVFRLGDYAAALGKSPSEMVANPSLLWMLATDPADRSTALVVPDAHGDLSENAEYHAAKEAHGLNEGRIAELEDKLSRAEQKKTLQHASSLAAEVRLFSSVTRQGVEECRDLLAGWLQADPLE